jgi:hypothetical protein
VYHFGQGTLGRRGQEQLEVNKAEEHDNDKDDAAVRRVSWGV